MGHFLRVTYMNIGSELHIVEPVFLQEQHGANSRN
mgnify:CR=1 FL=1